MTKLAAFFGSSRICSSFIACPLNTHNVALGLVDSDNLWLERSHTFPGMGSQLPVSYPVQDHGH
jgi:hypothetical protein